MADKKPFFITGANARINLNGTVVAFATDVSYRAKVEHASPRVLGKFEVEVHQPLRYDVSGNLTIIRYAKGITSKIVPPHPNVNGDRGNGIGTFDSSGSVLESILEIPDGRPDSNFNPSELLRSKTFDIDIFTVVDGTSCQIAKLRGCRMVETEFKLSKKNVGMQSFSFLAQYLDEDGFISRPSGVGQGLS